VERIAIFGALRFECRPVLRSLRQVTRDRLDGFTVWRGVTPKHEVWVVKTGMGLQLAGAAARAVSETGRFELFVSTGCAGALTSDLVPGDLTPATTIVGDPSGEVFETDADQREKVCRVAERAALRAIPGPVLCTPEMLMSVAERRAAAEAYGAVAVEMEGGAIAACAARHGVPFISVRSILDTANVELDHVGKFIDPQSGAVKPLAFAKYIVTHPGAVSGLLAMQRMMRASEGALERFFKAWFAAQ